MLFNSFEFVLGFLPICLGGFLLLARLDRPLAACAWVAVGSVLFYGYWAPEYLLLLGISVAGNYRFGMLIMRAVIDGSRRRSHRLLVAAIVCNLGALAYFKYANFFVDNLNVALGLHWSFARVVLPIGISFFTFTQIAYLVDTHQGKVRETNPIHYLLFVTYFPHLIAGPILHHAEMMPQFRDHATFRFNRENFLSGTVVFLIGLFKKVVLADGIQPYVSPVFDAPLGQALTGVEAWGGALAYTLQLYFDFSGYSDMAIGLSRMFNIELPLNFDSPYKARNIAEFWRRWHMTLSRFLRDYLYIPLGGNRHGMPRRYLNLMTTMLLGGLWHGAGWSFVIWGGLHGAYLAGHQAWIALRARIGWSWKCPKALSTIFNVLLTFLVVVVAWVFFRAKDLPSAIRVLKAMFDVSGFVLPLDTIVPAWLTVNFPNAPRSTLIAFGGGRQIGWIAALMLVVWIAPNTQQAMAWIRARNCPVILRRPEVVWATFGATIFWIALLLMINETRGVSEFIYFNF